MPDLKISEMTLAPSLNNDAEFPIAQLNLGSETNFRTSLSQLATQMASRLDVPTYVKTWNANTNTPALSSSVGQLGTFYHVSVAGSTSLNGINTWEIGDLAYFDGSVWTKIIDTIEADTGVHNTNWIGAIPSTAGNITYTKIGRTVTLQVPEVSTTSTSTAQIIAQTKLPSKLWPAFSIFVRTNAIVNNSDNDGQLEILAGDGSMIFYATSAGTLYPTGQVSGFRPQAFTYISQS